jgi:hypothetical protein
MKILKKLGLLVGAVVVLALIVPIFTKKNYAVEKETIIGRPKAVVFDYIRQLKNQDHYSVWAQMDPAMKKTYRGTDGTVGFVSAWESKKDDVGVGEQEIRKITDGKRIDFELRFFKPFEATEPAYMTTESVVGNSTKVKWGFSGHMKYPMNIMLLFMDMEKRIGDDLGTGLSNLKAVLEK